MFHLILNPAAGSGRAAKAIPALHSALRAQSLEYTLQISQFVGHAAQLVQTLPPLETVVAVGGDGTLHELIGGVLSSAIPRPIGLIPLGTGDDFARGVGLPIAKLEAALEVVRRGRVGLFDAAKVGSRFLINGFGVGFDAQVARTVKTTPAFLPGSLRYLLAIVQELRLLEPRFVRVYADQQLVHDDAALLIAVMNLKSYGGGLKINPNGNATDGVLEIVIGAKFNRLSAVGILPRLAAGTHLGHPQVKVVQAKKIRLEWRDQMPAHIDGELLEPAKIFELEVLPRALQIVLP